MEEKNRNNLDERKPEYIQEVNLTLTHVSFHTKID